jgi:hypothetical protein
METGLNQADSCVYHVPSLHAGAAMFVQCVVASEVIRISQGAPCRGATLRDVLTYTLSLLGVALSFWSGTVRLSALLMFSFPPLPLPPFSPLPGRPPCLILFNPLTDHPLVCRRGHNHVHVVRRVGVLWR